MKKLFFFMAILIMIAVPWTQAHAAKFRSPAGYSLIYPDNWAVATDEQKASFIESLKNIPRVEMGDRTIDLLLINPEYDNPFINTFSITVLPVKIPATVKEAKKAEEMVAGFLAKGGIRPTSLKSNLVRLGENNTISVEYGFRTEGMSMQQWSVTIPGKEQTYLISCGGNADLFAKNQPVFKEIIAGITLSSGVGTAWYGLPVIARVVMIVILALIMFLALRLMTRKKRNKKRKR